MKTLKKFLLLFIFVFSYQAFCQESKKINISGTMLDRLNNPVSVVHPDDEIKFKVTTDKDCYLSILCIDAHGVKFWLPIKNNFIEANSSRNFPDLAGQRLYVSNDGTFGDEQIIIYAASSEEGLPLQTNNLKYTNQDLQMIMKKQVYTRKNKDFSAGICNIYYRIEK